MQGRVEHLLDSLVLGHQRGHLLPDLLALINGPAGRAAHTTVGRRALSGSPARAPGWRVAIRDGFPQRVSRGPRLAEGLSPFQQQLPDLPDLLLAQAKSVLQLRPQQGGGPFELEPDLPGPGILALREDPGDRSLEGLLHLLPGLDHLRQELLRLVVGGAGGPATAVDTSLIGLTFPGYEPRPLDPSEPLLFVLLTQGREL